MSQHELWLAVLDRLSSHIPQKEVDLWLAPLELRLEEGRAVLLLPNRFFAQWVGERYLSSVQQALSQVLGHPVSLGMETGVLELAPALPAPPPVEAAMPPGPGLNPLFTFASFVVGPCNELAYSACQAVADQPGRLYNPVLLYGGAGLGKTHLLTAVGNHLLKRRPGFKVHYCSAEGFTNDLMQAVRFDGLAAFQEKYRQMDCLLIDDIQFLGGRERTQEELFHTFNALAAAGKQMVLSSDKIPREIAGLEKRLRTRFEGGLLADLQPPDEETKAVILQKKAAERGLDLSRKVALFLARQPENNVRVLEGYLTRVIAVSSFQGVEITMDLVRRLVSPLAGERRVSLDAVLSAVANSFGVKVSELKGSRKSREVSQPRQVAMYLARRLTRHSFPEIGRWFGGKDHSTVVKGVKKVETLLRDNPQLAQQVREVERSLREDSAAGGAVVE